MRHNLPDAIDSFYNHEVVALGKMMRKIFVVYARIVAKIPRGFGAQALDGVIARLRSN